MYKVELKSITKGVVKSYLRKVGKNLLKKFCQKNSCANLTHSIYSLFVINFFLTSSTTNEVHMSTYISKISNNIANMVSSAYIQGTNQVSRRCSCLTTKVSTLANSILKFISNLFSGSYSGLKTFCSRTVNVISNSLNISRLWRASSKQLVEAK